MGSLTDGIIGQINSAKTYGDLERWIWKAGDLLRKTTYQNYLSGFEDIDKEEVSETDGQRIQSALLEALHRNSEARFVGAILFALSDSKDQALKQIYVNYLAEHVRKLRESNYVVSSALAGLDRLGEPVYEKNPDGMSSSAGFDLGKNNRQAQKYLVDLGILIPWS
jgi:hypothetical protein